MFCSKCGKTLLLDANQCPACGHPVGESRFEGSPYTSAQAHILPGDDVRQTITQSYTRTNYTSMGDEVRGDVDTRTTYRPTYGGDSMPEEIRRDMRAAVNPSQEDNAEEEARKHAEEDGLPEDLSEEARASLDNMDSELSMEGLDLSQFRAKPIESSGQSGISADVSDLIQELENEPQKRSSRRRAAAYGDYEDVSTGDAAQTSQSGGQSEVFDDIDEEEFEELRHSEFGLKQLLKVLAVLVVAAVVIVGGLMWFRYVRNSTPSSPIENVREEFYDAGIAMIKEHAATETVTGILQAYSSSENGLTELSTTLQSSSAELQALLPEEATENEQLFMDALQQIEKNIGNCITSDALAITQKDENAAEQSTQRWTVVNNAIATLEAARSATELTAVINGEEVDVLEPEASPTPTPPVNYNTLSKGDKSDEVLEMQNRLYELGFLLDDRDGAFGSKTQTAVKMFQQAAGLEITGIADNNTLTALYADDAPRTSYAQPTATPAPEATAEPTPDLSATEVPAA